MLQPQYGIRSNMLPRLQRRRGSDVSAKGAKAGEPHLSMDGGFVSAATGTEQRKNMPSE
jgi:hypothetical protein